MIGEAVDPAFFDPELEQAPPAQEACEPSSSHGGGQCVRDLVLLSVFKWERRKGWDVLLDAYWAAFEPHEPIVLRLRTFVPSWEVRAPRPFRCSLSLSLLPPRQLVQTHSVQERGRFRKCPPAHTPALYRRHCPPR